MAMRRIVPVLLSGGAGSRLWPLSRESYPKQLLPILGEKSLLQQTVLRVCDPAMFAPPLAVVNADHRFAISEQLRALGIADATILLEPAARNTAPAAAIAALVAFAADPEAVILLLPVDHFLRDIPAFHRTVQVGATAVEAGRLVLFGVPPTAPVTGYGYIEVGPELATVRGAFEVAGFVEKPDREAAVRYVRSGSYLWNSGMFLVPARLLLTELERLAPDILVCARRALLEAVNDLEFLRLDAAALASSPAISIDYAVLEKTDRAALVRAEFDWNDVGSWSALWDAGNKDSRGNVSVGEVITEDTAGCYVRSDGPLVAALGVDDLVIAATQDVVLVTRKDRDQEVKTLVDRLKTNGHHAATQTVRVHRPWGFYQSIHAGERFQVKRITVNPGAKLSLQKHFHRAEHWIVVNGTALVTRDGEKVLLRENESIFVPLGCMHRLENPGKLPLNLIEVQSGPYLGEDDIVRLEDVYRRDQSG